MPWAQASACRSRSGSDMAPWRPVCRGVARHSALWSLSIPRKNLSWTNMQSS